MNDNFIFETDLAAKTIRVVRDFNAPVEKVWKAWTDPDLLEKWWGPKPWKAVTKSMDFTTGGVWLYYMAGPGNEKHWCYVKFTEIEYGSRFVADSLFSDENGAVPPGAQVTHWDNKFIAVGDKTKVVVDINFDDEATMKMMVERGFQGGFTIGLNQLAELLG